MQVEMAFQNPVTHALYLVFANLYHKYQEVG